MRTTSIVTVTALALVSTSAVYYLFRDDALPGQAEVTTPAISSTSTLGTTNTAIRDERRNQLATPEQRQLSLMHEKIANLEARLRDMEATASEYAQDPTVSRPDESVVNNDTEKAKTKKLSEGDFGHWMDKTLDAGDFDRDTTKSIIEQMATSLAEVPGLNLADMQCGARFCRASFVADNGKPPQISQLLGASPFIESGFTINEPDGRVKVYFTQPGESLSDLRSEAQESALRDMPPQ